MDNSMQFTGKKFLLFYDEYHIRVDWAAVAHPRTNGQVLQLVEQVRRMMGRGASHGALEPKDDPQLGHRLHAILHGL